MKRPSFEFACQLALLAILFVAVLGCESDDFIDIRMGNLQVTTNTVGVNLDPDGYRIRVTGQGNNFTQTIGINETLLVAVLEEAVYSVRLEDVAANCTAESNPRDITIVAENTTRTTFIVTCG